MQVDTFTIDSEPGDVVLLCSDGLTTMVDEDTDRAAAGRHRDAAAAAAELVRAALAAGGEDNVTVIVFRIDDLIPIRRRPDTGAGSIPVLPPELWSRQRGRRCRGRWRGRRRRSGRRRTPLGWVFGTIAAIAVIAAVSFGAVAGLRWSHFVGADERTGRVAVFQGVPFELPFGVHLYHETFLSDVPYRSLSAAERKRLFDHRLRSQSSAQAAIGPLELP